MTGSLFIISAPSGAGKTSLVTKLIEKDQLIQVSVSSTTRPKRPGEEDGINYHFLTLDAFESKVAEQDFLEHAKVFDHYYGTSKSSVEKQLKDGKDVILEIDWQGAQQVRQLIPEAISIFILPPSLRALEQRLKSRATDSDEVIARRMQDAVSEMQHYKEFDYLVINNVFDIALEALHTIFLADRQTLNRQYSQHQVLINELTQPN
ncbi:MAG: guanylate kinase [Piscirickettsiaceae bacterium CG_4_9_14_3_um_filter_43_564]|nr:guanylate kinase [Thiomicrospira sp.]OIP94399.1 MAG: guanylate kinase [Thiomicrospira sp. CG2_30_44_34]PIQ05260.1 MAG: guanylate kinase [Piscirickettsiaceae bacterium CG18_big_fil_WC_8_21_14_2_50_44_103]PIU39424.1 MAG: guanylate kinase [Piscirickettsiaceae bacterium CG07_land_8_20_14_0_80_44_28]PIW57778.1 MAG: guanylate kinase [Piscirickettsiaceae bacterium CG12_big_fil_rev_8_21_14_0_65_44_934]PIW77679.1 MAG: guanylate kinase [Piscirickettsiaceae bacterium CG_4_8_14_3_um_filter_44_38]PIX78